MSKDNKFFDDLIKLSGSAMDAAFNSVVDMRKQFDDMVDEKVDQILKKHQMVTREEFEVVKEMAEKARLENEKLSKQLKDIKTKK